MPIAPLPIANGSYESDSKPVSAQQCINLYPVIEDTQALAPETLRATPGLTYVNSAGTGKGYACRGAHRFNNKPYFVQGSTLYRLEIDNTLTSLGTITGSKRVSMAENGSQLMILEPGGDGFILDTADTLTKITDADFTANGNPQAVVFLDGYFVCTTDANKFITSALNDGLNYNALDFGTAESSTDGVVSPIVFKNQLFIAGERTWEAFNNVGGAGFPFQRMNLFLDQGVTGLYAAVNAPNTFVFLGAGEEDFPAVWMITGNTTQKLSTKAIDHLLLKTSRNDLRAAYAWAYSQGGHQFVGFNIGHTTIVYDFSSGRWHERQSRVPQGPNHDIEEWRAAAVVSAYNRIFVGDSQGGTIGELDINAYADYTDEKQHIVSTQPFQNNMRPFSVPYIELTAQSGVGVEDDDHTTTDSQSSDIDPQVMMDRSRDGGQTWDQQRFRSIGKIGEYDRRAIWRRNGRVDRFDVYRFTITAPVKVAGIQLTAEVVS